MSEYNAFTAKVYDPILAKPLRNIRKSVVEQAKQLGAKTVIDLCCGTGHQLSFFNGNSQFQKVIGVDLSPYMLQVAKKYGVNCYLADATNTDFKSEEFDLSLISFALHEKPFEQAQQIVKEAIRITKNQGYLLIVDYVYDHKTKRSGKITTWLIERLVGGEHFRNFKRFIQLGGLKRLTKHNLQMIKDLRFVNGAIALQVFKVNK